MQHSKEDETRLLQVLEQRYPRDIVIGESGSRLVYSAGAVRSRIQHEISAGGRLKVLELASELHIPPRKIREIISADFPDLIHTKSKRDGLESLDSGGDFLSEDYIEARIIRNLDDFILSKGVLGISKVGLASNYNLQSEFFNDHIMKRAIKNEGLKHSVLKKNGLFYNIEVFESQIASKIIDLCIKSSKELLLTTLAHDFNIDIADTLAILQLSLKGSVLTGEIYANNSMFIPQKMISDRLQTITQQVTSNKFISISFLRSNFISNLVEYLLPIADEKNIFLIQFSNVFVDSSVICSICELFRARNLLCFDDQLTLPGNVIPALIDASLIEIEDVLLNYQFDLPDSEYSEIVSFCLLEDVNISVTQYFASHGSGEDKLQKSLRIASAEDIKNCVSRSSNNIPTDIQSSSTASSPVVCKPLAFLKSYCESRYVVNSNCISYLANEVVIESMQDDIIAAAIDAFQKLKLVNSSNSSSNNSGNNNNQSQLSLARKCASDLLNLSRIQKSLKRSNFVDLSKTKLFRSKSSTDSLEECDDTSQSYISVSTGESLKSCVTNVLKETLIPVVFESISVIISSLSQHAIEYRDSIFDNYWKNLILRLRSVAILENRKPDDIDKYIIDISDSFKRGEETISTQGMSVSSLVFMKNIHRNLLLSKCLDIVSVLIRFSLFQSNALHLFQAYSTCASTATREVKKTSKHLDQKLHLSIKDSIKLPLSAGDIQLMYANLPKATADILVLLLNFIPGSILTASKNASELTDVSCASSSSNFNEKAVDLDPNNSNSKVKANVWNFVGVLYYASSSLQLVCRFDKKRDLKSQLFNNLFQDELTSCKNSLRALICLTKSTKESPNVFSECSSQSLEKLPSAAVSVVNYILIKTLSVLFSTMHTSSIICSAMILKPLISTDPNYISSILSDATQEDKYSKYLTENLQYLLAFVCEERENSKRKREGLSRMQKLIAIFTKANSSTSNKNVASTITARPELESEKESICVTFQVWLDEVFKEVNLL